MSGPVARRPFPLPGPVAIFVVVLGVLLYAAFLSKGPWDSDYYWHVKTGELIANGQFPRTDPFSFTWGGMPWTLHEWLSELLIYRLVDGIGYMGAVYVFAFVPGIAIGILAFALHRLGLRTAAVIAGTSFSALLVIPYATLRPQALSWIMFAILVGGLVHLRPDRARWILLLPPLFIVWANLHGLWVIGLVVLGVYTVLSLVGLTPMSGARRWAAGDGAARYAGDGVHAGGSVAHPLPLALRRCRGLGHGEHQRMAVARLPRPGALAAAHLHGSDGDLRPLAGPVVDEHPLLPRDRHDADRAPERCRRGDPGGAALAVGIDAALRDWRPTRRTQSPRLARQRRVLELVMAAVVAIAGVVIFVPRDPEATVDESIERELPVQGIELLLREVPDGRILSWYGWGGYVIGTMYDHGARVFVDGRNDMYDDSILEDYNLVRGAEPGWEEIPDRYEVDAMVFPPFEAISKGPAVLRRLVRGVPRRQRGRVPADLRLTS